MAVNKIEYGDLERLVARIEEVRRDGSWRLSTGEIAEALGMDPVTLYRTIYENPRGVTFSDAIDGFDQDRIGELVTLLEKLGFSSAEDHLYRAGLFVPLKAGSRLTERLVNRYVRALSAHQVDWDRILHELERKKRYREVAWNYLSEALPLESIAEEVVERFLREEGLPDRGRAFFLRYLRSLRERHLLDYSVIGAPFYEDVYRYAVAKGYIRPREQESFHGGGTDSAGPGRRGPGGRGKQNGGDPGTVEWARSILGVGESADRDEVRRAYRREMLRYHPDVNPTGAEVAKELNAAYATLLRSTGGSR